MPVAELTSSTDRYQSAHSGAAGVSRAFAIGAPARPVRPQTVGVRPQSYGARPQSYGAPAQSPPTHSVRLFTPRFNPGAIASGAGWEVIQVTHFPRKRCFECGSTRHFRDSCP